MAVTISDETPRALRQALGRDESFTGRFDLPLEKGEIYLGRTSPIIEGLAGWTLDQALDPAARDAHTIASRCGVISSSAVSVRTTLVLARFRYHLRTTAAIKEAVLCEEIIPLAYQGSATQPQWLTGEEGELLLNAKPERNLIPTAIEQQIGLLIDSYSSIQQALGIVAKDRAEAQLQAHKRVRQAAKSKGRVTIEPVLPVDILGAYVILPRL